MGGTVLVRACPILQDAKYRVSGVIVLDVVEGTRNFNIMFLTTKKVLLIHLWLSLPVAIATRLRVGSHATHARFTRLSTCRVRLARGSDRVAVSDPFSFFSTTLHFTPDVASFVVFASNSFFFLRFACSLSNRTIRNPTSARVSVPSMFTESTDGPIPEHQYVWRAPLHLTAPFWTGTFLFLA